MYSVFDNLVRGISIRERREMLARIEERHKTNPEPMRINDSEALQPVIVSIELAKLPIFLRLYIALISLFSSDNLDVIVERILLRRTEKKINQAIPDFFDFKKFLVGEKFHEQIVNLLSAVEVFRPSILDNVEKHKTDFLIFISSFELPERHLQLEDDVDPDTFSNYQPAATPKEFSRKLKSKLEEHISEIDPQKREIMNSHLRILHKLTTLVRFPYLRLLSFFSTGSDGKVGFASIAAISNLMIELGDALYIFDQPPGRCLLEALFLFDPGNYLIDDNKGLEMDLSNWLRKSEMALENIRKINMRIPWLDVMKAVSRNINYTPEYAVESEDWYYHFTEFWHKALDKSIKEWLEVKQIKSYLNSLQELWGLSTISMMPGYRSSEYTGKIHLRYEFSIAALRVMFMNIFQDKFYHALNLIKIDGKFYKKSNRKEFEEILNKLLGISNRIMTFESRLAVDGELGIMNSKIRLEHNGDELEKQIKDLVERMDKDCHEIIEPVVNHMRIMSSLIGGILEGNQGKYDTLSNLAEIGGQGHGSFRRNLTEIFDIIKHTTSLLNNLFQLEKQR